MGGTWARTSEVSVTNSIAFAWSKTGTFTTSDGNTYDWMNLGSEYFSKSSNI